MPNCFRGLVASLAVTAWMISAPASAVTISIDYTYDTGFFAPGTQARNALVAATDYYSSILNDTLAAIPTPPTKFVSPTNGMVEWTWTLDFNHPAGLGSVSIENGAVAADEFIIYPGSKLYDNSTLAIGSAGGSQIFRSGPPNSAFSTPEIAQINAVRDLVVSTITRRGEETGFAAWGGSISFDADTEWHFNHTTPPAAGKVDLYTVALHELAHTLGFGVSPEWTALTQPTGTTFTGQSATSLYGGPVPLASGSSSHWQNGLGSTVFGGSASQTAVMTAGISTGNRRHLTAIDAAALADIGWSIAVPTIVGDYNDDGSVNAADYTVWRNTVGQGSNLAADGNNSGWIDTGDYAVWKSHFGAGSGAGAGNETRGDSHGVPEPTAVIYLITCGMLVTGFRCKLFSHRVAQLACASI